MSGRQARDAKVERIALLKRRDRLGFGQYGKRRLGRSVRRSLVKGPHQWRRESARCVVCGLSELTAITRGTR